MRNQLITLCIALLFTMSTLSQNTEKKYEGFMKTESGLLIKITEKGKGVVPQAGDRVSVHYTGKLEDGTKFDSSLDRGQPFSFELGSGQVIKGWDEGIALLPEGSKATLVIPPQLGYGDKAQSVIPANSTLIFDVELVQVAQGIRIQPFDCIGKDTIKTPSGLKYIVVQKGSGEKVIPGRRIMIHYSAYFADGKMFDSSVKKNQPLKVICGTGGIAVKGLDEGLLLMRTGDKFRLIIPPQLGFGANGPKEAQGKEIYFDVELISVMPEITVTPYDISGKEAITTTSGLKYYVIAKGNGAKAEIGKTVIVHYTGYLENGNIFDSSVKRDEPIKFPLGKGQVIKGWDEGIGLMQVGDKLRLVIPPDLGYGSRDMGSIPANSTLIFDVELVGVQ